MAHMNTPVLNTMNGCPAADMALTLQPIDGGKVENRPAFMLSANGTNQGSALLKSQTMAAGRNGLVVSMALHFLGAGAQ